MTLDEMTDLIRARIPNHSVGHNDLWRICGSPQSADSYLFDEALLALADRREIGDGHDGVRRVYWRKA